MNEEPKERPIRELLHDISSNNESSYLQPRGLIRPKLVSRITFFASLVGLLFITATFLATIWDLVNEVLAFRCIVSTIVVLVALFVFRAINSQFE